MQELKNKNVWLVWDKNEERGKIPVNAKTGGNAQSDNPTTWTDYKTAENASLYHSGIGFMFTQGYCGIDIDGHKDGSNDYSHELLDLFKDTYIEKSPSGTGYHIICKVDYSKIPVEQRVKGGYKVKSCYYVKNPHNELECYIGGLTNRFFTFTGNPVSETTDITDCTKQVLYFFNKYMRKGQDKEMNIIDIARKAKNGEKFIALYDNGDTTAYNNDDSSADMALCNMLAFYLQGNESEIDRAFRQSALYRSKWEREDYRAETIGKAIEMCGGEFYEPQRAVKRTTQASNEESGREFLTIENFEQELLNRGVTVRYNLITNEIDIAGTDISREHILETLPVILYSDLRQIYKGVSMQNMMEFLMVIATRNTYNPVLDYLKSVEYDGKDHLTDVYKALNVMGDSLSQTLIYKWLWQGLALLHNDGNNPYGADGVLTLAGGQGIGKTTFFRKVSLKPNFFREGQSINNYDKDNKRRCLTTWIAELGELDCTFKSDMGMLKAFITNDYDEYRLPYGRADKKAPRRTNLGATVNGTEFLIDPTGNRRFWTIPLTTVDLELMNEIDFTQVWLQVWEQDAQNNLKGFRLTREEQEQLKERNSQCEKSMPAEDEIRDIFARQDVIFEEMTVTQFKGYHDALRPYSVKKISAVLDKMGVEQESKRVNGKLGRYRTLPKPSNEYLNNPF